MFRFTQLDVENFDLKDNPTVEVLAVWLRLHPQSTIGDFLRAVVEIERYDILHCDTIQAAIGKGAVDKDGFLADSTDIRGTFPVAAARLWNGLPPHVTAAPSLSIICCHLKSHLFSLSYPSFWLFAHLYSAR